LERKTKTEKFQQTLKDFRFFSKMAELSNETEKPKKRNYNKPRKIFDFEQIGGIEQRNGKPKQKNYNKPRKISEF